MWIQCRSTAWCNGHVFHLCHIPNLQTERNDVSISINDPDVTPTSLSIAVIGDTRLPGGPQPLTAFRGASRLGCSAGLGAADLVITYLTQKVSNCQLTVKRLSML